MFNDVEKKDWVSYFNSIDIRDLKAIYYGLDNQTKIIFENFEGLEQVRNISKFVYENRLKRTQPQTTQNGGFNNGYR